MPIEINDIVIALSILKLQLATEVENSELNPVWIMNYFMKW